MNSAQTEPGASTPAAALGVVGIGALLVGVYLATLLASPSGMAGFALGPGGEVLLRWGAKMDALVSDGQWQRLMTAFYLHDGAPHLMMNTAWLAAVGFGCARLTGWRMVVGTAVLAGFMGFVASWAVGMGASVGASGGVYGVTGLLVVAVWRSRQQVPQAIRWRVLSSLGVLVAAMLAMPLALSGVDHAAHSGGFVTGLALGQMCGSRRAANVLVTAALLLSVIAGTAQLLEV